MVTSMAKAGLWAGALNLFAVRIAVWQDPMTQKLLLSCLYKHQSDWEFSEKFGNAAYYL